MLHRYLEFSKWDSDILNINYYKLNINSLFSWLAIKKEITDIPNNSIIFSRIESSKLNDINTLIKNNFYISDVLVELQFNFDKYYSFNDNNKHIVLIKKELTYRKQCVDLIQSEFSIGRIHEDVNLGLESGKKIYKEWVLNNFINNFTISYIKGNSVQGFLQYTLDGYGSLRVSFIVVKGDCKNRGIGSALLNSVKDSALKNNCKKIIVGTQLKNINAINFYIKNLFYINKTFIGLHYYVRK